MSRTRKKTEETGFARVLAPLRSWQARVFLCACVIAGLAVGMYAVWRWVGDRIVGDSAFRISVEDIEITPPPEWIRSDIKAEVASILPMESLNSRDSELTVRIAQQFAQHPWVANVRRVSKHPPARVIVELEYRHPVAVVEVRSEEGEKWLLPIDRNAVILPISDFTEKEASHSYLRINVGGAMERNLAGSSWGDVKVHGAARIAAALKPHWMRLGLQRIEAVPDGRSSIRPADVLYNLVTASGTQIPWGHSPGEEDTREPTCESKVRRLVTHFDTHQTLDASKPTNRLDLQDASESGDRADTAAGGGPSVR